MQNLGLPLQIYTSQELHSILSECGFKSVKYYDIDGSHFIENKTVNMLIVAVK